MHVGVNQSRTIPKSDWSWELWATVDVAVLKANKTVLKHWVLDKFNTLIFRVKKLLQVHGLILGLIWELHWLEILTCHMNTLLWYNHLFFAFDNLVELWEPW